MSGGGALVQLSTQTKDFLTDDPRNTYFREKWAKHTLFAQEPYMQTFTGDVQFGKRCSVLMSKSGDLIGPAFLQITLPDLTTIQFDVADTPATNQASIVTAFFTSRTTVKFTIAPNTAPPGTMGQWSPAAIVVSRLKVNYVDTTLQSTICSWNVANYNTVVASGGIYTDYSGTLQNVNTSDKSPQNQPPAVASFQMQVFISDPTNISGGTSNSAIATAMNPGVTGAYVDYANHEMGVGLYGSAWLASNTAPPVFTFNNIAVPGPIVPSVSVDGTRWYTWTYTVGQVTVGSPPNITVSVENAVLTVAVDGIVSNARNAYNVKWCDAVGFAIVKNVELVMQGARIDYYERNWQDIWSELFVSIEKKPGLYAMVGKYTNVASGLSHYDIWDWTNSSNAPNTYFVPLLFFHRDLRTAISLASLSQQEVRFNFEWSNFAECIKSNSTLWQQSLAPSNAPPISVQFFSDVVYLDTPERLLFAQTKHDDLVTVLQSNFGSTVTAAVSAGQTIKINLPFTNPIKELIWVYVSGTNDAIDTVNGNNFFMYEDAAFTSATVLINGNKRINDMSPAYFQLMQPYLYHSYPPQKPVYLYSFAIHPEDALHPSGHLNASRLSALQLSLTMAANIPAQGTVYVFAPTWNVVRYSEGMVGLVFTRAN